MNLRYQKWCQMLEFIYIRVEAAPSSSIVFHHQKSHFPFQPSAINDVNNGWKKKKRKLSFIFSSSSFCKIIHQFPQNQYHIFHHPFEKSSNQLTIHRIQIFALIIHLHNSHSDASPLHPASPSSTPPPTIKKIRIYIFRFKVSQCDPVYWCGSQHTWGECCAATPFPIQRTSISLHIRINV